MAFNGICGARDGANRPLALEAELGPLAWMLVAETRHGARFRGNQALLLATQSGQLPEVAEWALRVVVRA